MAVDFQRIFELLPGSYVVFGVDSDFTILAATDAYLDLVNTTMATTLGKSLFHLFPEDLDNSNADWVRNLRASVYRVLERQTVDVMSLQKVYIQQSDESFKVQFWSAVNKPVLQQDNSTVVEYIIQQLVDVTKITGQQSEQQSHVDKMQVQIYQHLKKIEQSQLSLSASHESYRTFVSALPVGIFHIRRDGSLIYVNPAWQEITGIPDLHDLLNSETPWFQLVHPDDVDFVTKEWENIRSIGSTTSKKVEFRYLNGTKQRYVLFQICPDILLRESLLIQSYVGSITDITELKECEKDRLSLVIEHHKHLQQFVDAMCHELRNPLNGIIGNYHLLNGNLKFLQSWMENLGSSETAVLPLKEVKEAVSVYLNQDRESTECIRECAMQQKIICDDILNLSKLEGGKIELKSSDFNPKEIIRAVLCMQKLEIERKQLRLTLNFPEEEFIVYNDATKFRQVVASLLNKAIQISPNEGNISVGFEIVMRQDCKILQFSVQDDGTIMTEQELSQILGPFAQGHRTTDQEYGGSGLGLVITRHLIELMGGNLFFDSQSQDRSSFIFTMKCPSPSDFTKEKEQQHLIHYGAGKHILIVDDNIVNQKVLKRTLEHLEYKCSLASNGQDAVTIFEQSNCDIKSESEDEKPVDLIIMDVEMPILDGLQATRLIREKEKFCLHSFSVPIIGLSGYARHESEMAARESGMTDYLVKPPDREELLRKISFYLLNNN